MNENINNNEKYFRVGIYERLSDQDRDKVNTEDISESIKNQRHLLMAEIEKRSDFILVGEYCDEDLSGAGTYRPEFERLIKDCEEGKIDVVLCKSQSRFSRDMEVIEKYIHNKFIEWNVRFIGLADNADTSNLGNKKSRQINGLVNEWYLEDVSNNIRSAFKAKMKQGEFISPFAPYGYEVSKEDNNKLIVDKEASEIVKCIFNLYLSGLGFTAIAKSLNKKQIPSPSLYKYKKGIKLNVISSRPREEIKWSHNAIKTILTNEVYLGHLIQGKRTTVSYKNHKIKSKGKKYWIRRENTHEAIIDEEIFNNVQNLIKERTKPIKSSGGVHIFSGKVFCLECNHYMRKKNSSKHEYLVCSNNKDGYDMCINKSSIRYDLLENLILEKINEKIEKFYDKEILQKLYNKESRFKSTMNFLEKRKKELEKEISNTKKYLKNLYEDKVNGIITKEQFKDLITEYNKNEKMYNSKIKSISDKITHYKKNVISSKNCNELFGKYKKLKTLSRIIIQEFIDKIYIGKINKEMNSRNIQIKWNFN
ncbi:MAG: recombinase family protein [Bacilli bacterium]|nr:recombinase family protein [Bacilli bacterium]